MCIRDRGGNGDEIHYRVILYSGHRTAVTDYSVLTQVRQRNGKRAVPRHGEVMKVTVGVGATQ